MAWNSSPWSWSKLDVTEPGIVHRTRGEGRHEGSGPIQAPGSRLGPKKDVQLDFDAVSN